MRRFFLPVLFLLTLLPLRAAEPCVFFLIGEPEYHTATTLPAFAKTELEPRGIRSTFSVATPADSDDFPNFDALKSSDLLFISVRRHHPNDAQMAAIRAHIAAGKPVAGIRTASHAFGKRKGEAEGVWEHFDTEILGGDYANHYGKDIPTFGRIVSAAASHPVLAGVDPAEFVIPSHLYKYPHLGAAVVTLMTARMEGRPEVEPIAWVNTVGGSRVFYTSLGAEEDFAIPQFRRLLLNGILWTLKLPTGVK